jgi:hypothetical protein
MLKHMTILDMITVSSDLILTLTVTLTLTIPFSCPRWDIGGPSESSEEERNTIQEGRGLIST